jgi:hypothetical protein
MRPPIRSIAVGALSLLLTGNVTAGGISGAIYTTNSDGAFVNGNIYDAAEDVYLNGGPRANRNCAAAGLPDGEYYFQVTDPSGKVLVSGDPLTERTITVTNGVISGYSGTHPTGVGRCGELTVQVLDPSHGVNPNPGGEYKVWLTPVHRFGCCHGRFGFAPRYSKTDNFKIQPPDDGDGDGDGDGEPV